MNTHPLKPGVKLVPHDDQPTAAKHTPNLAPDWVGEFHTFDNWVSTCTGEFETKAICVDTKGRRCNRGADFMRARDENCFPVRYFWECKPYDTARQRDLLLNFVLNLRDEAQRHKGEVFQAIFDESVEILAACGVTQ